MGVGVNLGIPLVEYVVVIQLDGCFVSALSLFLHEVGNLVRDLLEGYRLTPLGKRSSDAVNTRNDRLLVTVVLRIVVARIIQGERSVLDDVWLAIACQRVGTFERRASTVVIALDSGLELVHTTWLRNDRKIHILLCSEFLFFSTLVGIFRIAILGPCVIDIAILVDTHTLLATIRSAGIRCADELTVTIVSLYHHPGQRIVCAAILYSRNVDVADLAFLIGDDHMLTDLLPRHRDRVTFDVLARPRVYSSAECRAGTFRGIEVASMVLRVIALPGIAHGIVGSG